MNTFPYPLLVEISLTLPILDFTHFCSTCKSFDFWEDRAKQDFQLTGLTDWKQGYIDEYLDRISKIGEKLSVFEDKGYKIRKCSTLDEYMAEYQRLLRKKSERKEKSKALEAMIVFKMIETNYTEEEFDSDYRMDITHIDLTLVYKQIRLSIESILNSLHNKPNLDPIERELQECLSLQLPIINNLEHVEDRSQIIDELKQDPRLDEWITLINDSYYNTCSFL